MSVLIKEVDLPTWKTIEIDNHVGIFATSMWLESIGKAGLVPKYFLIEDSGVIIGCASGILQEFGWRIFPKLGGGFYIYCGPCMWPGFEAKATECLQQLLEYLQRKRCPQLLLRAYDYDLWLNFDFLGLIEKPRTEYVLRIDNEAAMRARMNRGKKHDLNKAMKAGLEVIVSQDVLDIEVLEQCMFATRHKKQMSGVKYNPWHTYNFLDKKVVKRLLTSGLGKIFIALKGKDHVAAYLALIKGEKAFALLGGVMQNGIGIGSYSFLFWESLINLKQQGVRYLNMGGVPGGEEGKNLASFKRFLGAEETIRCSGRTHLWGLGGKELLWYAVSERLWKRQKKMAAGHKV